jgi:hypothetical protein
MPTVPVVVVVLVGGIPKPSYLAGLETTPLLSVLVAQRLGEMSTVTLVAIPLSDRCVSQRVAPVV